MVFDDFKKQEISKKLDQFRRIQDGSLTMDELAERIKNKRVKWLREHLGELFLKYQGLSPEEQAYHIIFIEHMRIDPKNSRIIRVSPKKIKIESYNFCPGLEACLQMGLDTRVICRQIGEPAFREMVRIIHPNLTFSRNYNNLRPNSPYCEEYIELKE